jgi:Tol biopolymer transport system component
VALSPGTRLGSYEVTALIGEGGMGQVYRARDTKLDRDVAIKVLPDLFANDPDRLARFQREAKTLAALNHPNIAHIHGLEESGGVRALVMELVEGPTLADRIATNAIPVNEALTIAKQIAEALEAAHDQGIVHRDLKPANIKVRPDGIAKVLDFGLAKALEPAGVMSASISISPTITSPAMTQAGIILGTAAYMSPEQAVGKAADKRSDLWAFGVVLLEMLTGRPVFSGETVSHVLAAVLKDEPDWTQLPSGTPSAIQRLLRRCLNKDRKRRLDSAAAARLEIDEALSPPTIDSAPVRARQRIALVPIAAAVAGVLGLGLGFTVANRAGSRPIPAIGAHRLNADLGADVTLDTNQGSVLALSPDGTLLAFIAENGVSGRTQLYVRRLSELQAIPLAGTEGARSPFFSSDGQWIAFVTGYSPAGSALRKIAVAGGAVTTLCQVNAFESGAWSEDNWILFSEYRSSTNVLRRVPANGGKPEPVEVAGDPDPVRRWPQVLPGGKALLYTANKAQTQFDDATIVVQALPNGPRKVVLQGGFAGQYLPSGHVVYMHEGTLYAVGFDLDRLETVGQPAPVLEGIAGGSSGIGARGQFAASNSGTVVYVPAQLDRHPIHWLDREGHVTLLRSEPANWTNLQFAPDGRRLAMEIADGRRRDVWTYEWQRDTLTRLTTDGDADKPVWTPDSQRIVFGSSQGDKMTPNLYWKRADGTGDAKRLTDSKSGQGAWSWHPNGRFLAFHENNQGSRDDVMILPMEGDEVSGWNPGRPTAFANTPFSERAPMFSPDGHWLAYNSNESGRDEVYVRPFPGPGGRWLVSTAGGSTPTWSRARRELLYVAPDQRIMMASYSVDGDVFHADKPNPWSDTRIVPRPGRGGGPVRSFDLHPDGNRIAAAVAPAIETKQDKLVFVFNFFDELRRIAPERK